MAKKEKSEMKDLLRRPRRNRAGIAIRSLIRETRVGVEDLIYPLFVRDGKEAPEAVGSMPGVFRYSVPQLVKECRSVAELGIPAVALFPCIDEKHKSAKGTHALSHKNVLFHAISEVKAACPGLLVITDVALDPYTDHGHDGVLDDKGHDVANDRTIEILQQLAIKEAEAGADLVAPSDMMDGRIGAIRRALDGEGFDQTGILSYAVKFASAMYGPFRDAVGSKKKASPIDKRGYQMDPANLREALLEARLDEDEGADILMVKPAGLYLDVIRAVREQTELPLAAYQVSGEYAQIHAAAKLGWLSYEAVRDESLLAIKRAGADMILTYFAREVAMGLR
ncbi:MAG: porphobilinogen synthase [Chthoniobacterales bacterium]